MKPPVYDQEKLDEMRRKLYARSSAQSAIERHGLTDTPVDVARDWEVETPTEPEIPADPVAPPKRRRYRLYILVISLLVFVFGVGLSTLYLYFGGNQISSDNITLSIDGPLNVGGGEVLNFTVAVSNQNTIPMESATLIVKYPQGTRSAGDVPRTMFEDRIPVEEIIPGDARNIPLQVVVFGEEQTEQQISATIEYRVAGSNSVFYKEADPYTFIISSSPIVLRVENQERVSSGQTVDITLTIASNASAPQDNLLVSASYPNGFRFESSDPAPVFSNSVWSVDELASGEEQTITITGVMSGFAEEAARINFDLGPAQPNDPFIVGSILAEGSADFTIESPFVEIVSKVNGDETTSVTLEEGEDSRIDLEVTNTLDSTIYDLQIEVIPGGNVLRDDSIRGSNGFYNSNTGTISWQTANNPKFAEVGPGESRRLNFLVVPAGTPATGSYDLVVNIYAKKVAEESANTQLVGTTIIDAKFDSTIFLGSQAGRGILFSPVGDVPPQVGETTSYTVTLVAEAGVNDLTDVIVDSRLPVYINWLDKTQGDGEIIFNPVTQQIEWNAGTISAGSRAEISMQLSLTPSNSQVGSTPVLLQAQTMRATDRFTGSRLEVQAEPVYTELSTEAGYPEDNGQVIP